MSIKTKGRLNDITTGNQNHGVWEYHLHCFLPLMRLFLECMEAE